MLGGWSVAEALTNGADDAGPTEDLGWHVLGLEIGQPFHPRATEVLVCVGVTHLVSCCCERGVVGVRQRLTVAVSNCFSCRSFFRQMSLKLERWGEGRVVLLARVVKGLDLDEPVDGGCRAEGGVVVLFVVSSW